MDKTELTAWALKSGWTMVDEALCLTKNTGAHEPIVRMVLKGTVVNLEIKKPSGKWDKVASAAYTKLEYDEDAELPRGIGLESITGLTKLMRDNKDRMAFSKMSATPKED